LSKAELRLKSPPREALALRSPSHNGYIVNFKLDGVIINGSTKVEPLPSKNVQVLSEQELIGGAAYRT